MEPAPPTPKRAFIAAYLDEDKPLDAEKLEAQMSALTSFVGGLLFEVDREGRYLAVLAGEPALLARPVEDMRGLKIRDVIGEEIAAPFLEMFGRVLDTGRPENLDYTLDIPIGRRNFRCEARPTTAERKTLTLLVRDVTEETALKAKLVEAERLAAMGLVAASIGHEIRQPLAFATTSVEVLERELERSGIATDRAREALNHVRDAVERMAGIAASVGVVVPDRRAHREMSTDVRRPIDAAIDLCASELQGRAHVSLDVPELPRIHANEGELCQVIANLLLNAAHAVDPRAATTNRIEIHASIVEGVSGTGTTEKRIRITVSDNGCGINPANAERVFDAFFTTKAPGRGTGLGLFVSRRIVEESGGKLDIESPSLDVKGTRVHVTLPLAANTSHPADSVTRPRVDSERLNVLIIDDEPAFLRSVQLVLDGTHDVVVESNSKNALELLRADIDRFDAVLCDLSMPAIDGVAFYAEMHHLGIADRFVLMTAGAFTTHGEEFLRTAKCRRIAKPFTLDELLGVLGSIPKLKKRDSSAASA